MIDQKEGKGTTLMIQPCRKLTFPPPEKLGWKKQPMERKFQKLHVNGYIFDGVASVEESKK